jgi:hypothetical protein
MSFKPDLRLDWCGHDAAKYAVEHWHYSRRMPLGTMTRVGAWEDGKFIGCVLFARGANHAMADRWGCSVTEICELVRVALSQHSSAVSQIVGIALRMLRSHSPGLRLVVSFADTERGHHGGIYQAGNWVYAGRSQGSIEWFHAGRWKHNREMTGGAFGGKRKVSVYRHLPKRKTLGKHTYLMPLDRETRNRIVPLARPYPKRERSRENAAAPPRAEGGVNPTRSLHSTP